MACEYKNNNNNNKTKLSFYIVFLAECLVYFCRKTICEFKNDHNIIRLDDFLFVSNTNLFLKRFSKTNKI